MAKSSKFPFGDTSPGKIVLVYAAYDDNGEGGRGEIIGYYSTNELAMAKSAPRSWGQGHSSTVAAMFDVDGQLWTVGDAITGIDADADEVTKATREKALAKLTPEERKLLGV